MTSANQAIDPYEGFEFVQQDIVVSAEEQAEKLSVIGLDPAVHAGRVDASFYIGIGIRAGAAHGVSAEGNINMLTRLIQHRPARTGEVLTAEGRITSVERVPRGRRVSTSVSFLDRAGETVIVTLRESLKPDPDSAGLRGAGERPPPVIEDVSRLALQADFALTPEATCAYSTEGNAIHYEMTAANNAGFRAPIIGGGMGVHFIVAALGPTDVDGYEMDIYFRRPIFWDDSFSVGVMPDRSAAALVRDGKVLTEAALSF